MYSEDTSNCPYMLQLLNSVFNSGVVKFPSVVKFAPIMSHSFCAVVTWTELGIIVYSCPRHSNVSVCTVWTNAATATISCRIKYIWKKQAASKSDRKTDTHTHTHANYIIYVWRTTDEITIIIVIFFF